MKSPGAAKADRVCAALLCSGAAGGVGYASKALGVRTGVLGCLQFRVQFRSLEQLGLRLRVGKV